MTVVGTRPEIIRLSRVIARLDAAPDVEHVLVHTGQNYDPQLSAVFFDDLGLRLPDHSLEVDTSSLGAVMGGVLAGTERVITAERPDAFVVLGDTNSCLAAITAKRMRVPVYHLEAGNRCFDENVPEETNRRIVDHTADFNLAYTEHARRHLLAEGLPARRVVVTGSPMAEVLAHARERIDASDVLAREGLEPGGYVLVSAHREENVDAPDRLRALLDCLRAVHAETGLPVLVSTHPRTRKRLDALGDDAGDLDGLRFAAPYGFADYNRLQLDAHVVLSDSGTISEESAILGFPAVTLRESIERPEAIEAGAIVMTGLRVDDLLAGIRLVTAPDRVRSMPEGYDVPDVSHRVLALLRSTARVHHTWAGIRRP